MKTSFQDGVDAIYNAIVAQGTTPGGKSPADLVSSIKTMSGTVKVPIVLKENFQPASSVTPASSSSVNITLTVSSKEVIVTGTTSTSAGHGSYGFGIASITVGAPM